jgi:hypothetical protein
MKTDLKPEKVQEAFSFSGHFSETQKQNRLWNDLDYSCRGKFLDKLIKAESEGFDLVIVEFRKAKFLYERPRHSNMWILMGITPLGV